MKSKRGSDENLFSISGASEALGRSRRTITRAMKGVEADAIRSGLSLWRMATFIEMVNTRTQAPITVRGAVDNSDCAAAFAAFDRASAAMQKLPTLAQRRKAAKAMAPQVREMFGAMFERDAGLDVDAEHAMLRRNQAWLVMCRGYEKACAWSMAETHEVFALDESEGQDAA